MDSTPVELLEYESSRSVRAWLHDEISPEHLTSYQSQWTAAFNDCEQRFRAGRLNREEIPEDAHWKWERKMAQRRGKLGFESYCIECEGQIEGLLILNFLEICRIPVQARKDLVYLEYLATAPWNRRIGDQLPRFRRVGTLLFRAALQVSLANDLKGRIGLHSLPKAEGFYRDGIGMVDLGPDHSPSHQGLRYFELSEERASKIKI